MESEALKVCLVAAISSNSTELTVLIFTDRFGKTLSFKSCCTTTYSDRGSSPTYRVENTSSTAPRIFLLLYCVLACSWSPSLPKPA
eukprot:g63290.t1